MAEIIKGGAYQRPDGTWVNGKGEKIPAPSGAVYQVEEVEVPTPAPVLPGGTDEFGAPPVMATPKKTKKTGGD
jgi:hypothetical protein